MSIPGMQGGRVAEDWHERYFSEPNTGCKIWTGSTTHNGYAEVRIKKILFRVNRLVLEEKLYRPLNPGEEALHNCDNPPCINDRHLFPGTNLDNRLDSARKNRTARQRGSLCGKAILNEEIVLQIKKELRAGAKQKDVAAQYGVARPTIWFIASGRSWKHVQIQGGIQ